MNDILDALAPPQLPPLVEPHSIATVRVRIPPFWTANPRIWFCQIEAQFANSRITNDHTKYNTVVAALEGSILSQISDIILNPPETLRYDTLKVKLLERFEESEQSRLHTLLTSISLDDKKPTHLLRQMRELAGGNIADTALKSLFLQRLPQQAQAMFSISDQNLEQIAILADRFLEVTSCNVSTIQKQNDTIYDDQLKILTSKIENLTLEIASIKTSRQNFEHYKRPRSHSRSNSASRNFNTAANSKDKPVLCWYHRVHKNKAHKCIKPCNFSLSEN